MPHFFYPYYLINFFIQFFEYLAKKKKKIYVSMSN